MVTKIVIIWLTYPYLISRIPDTPKFDQLSESAFQTSSLWFRLSLRASSPDGSVSATSLSCLRLYQTYPPPPNPSKSKMKKIQSPGWPVLPYVSGSNFVSPTRSVMGRAPDSYQPWQNLLSFKMKPRRALSSESLYFGKVASLTHKVSPVSCRSSSRMKTSQVPVLNSS